MSEGMSERDEAVMQVSAGAESSSEGVETVEVDGEEYVPRDEYEKRVGELEDRLEKMEGFVGMHIADDLEINCVGPAITSLLQRVDELEEGQQKSDYEPSTKIEKIQKLIQENWDEWSCEGSVQTRQRKSKRGVVKSESVNKKVSTAMKAEYGEDCQAREVHLAMERLGEREGFSFGEKDKYKKLSRSK
jgi:hypothetical protein